MSLFTDLWKGSVWSGSVWNGGIGLPGWSPTDISQAEANALKAFWQATGGSGWTNPWVFGTLANDLYGVTVSDGKVTVIAVGDNNLDTDDANLDMSVFELTEAGTDGVLSSLVSSAGTNGTLDISGSAEPSSTGVGYITTLLSRGWTITVSSAEVTVTSGTTYVSTLAGEAMFFHDSIPFSKLVTSGDLVTLTDSAGVTATSYAHSAGAGIAKGTEIIDAWTNSVANPFETFTVSANTITQAINTTGNGVCYKVISSITKGRIYVAESSITVASGVTPVLLYIGSSGTLKTLLMQGISYFTHVETGLNIFVQVTNTTNFGGSTSVKAITDVPTTGLRLVKTAGGVTRDMASIGDGFNPNTIVKVSIGGA